MKKILITLLAVVAFSTASFAQDAKGTCKFPGTYDYVCADFYKGDSGEKGHIRLSNQAQVPVLEIKVKITCEIDLHHDEKGNVWQRHYESQVIYNETVYGIPAQDYKDIYFTMPKYDGIRNIKIEVGNLICKSQNE